MANQNDQTKATRAEAEEAIRTLLSYLGEDVNREGLIDTPKRVISAWDEYTKGYQETGQEHLEVQFSEVSGYKEMVLLKDIEFRSHCEHHLAPVIGTATIAYIPDQKVVGISKLARVVDVYANRLQLQERLCSNIANDIMEHLNPKGVAVHIKAQHHCITYRGISKAGAVMETTIVRGAMEEELNRSRFFDAIKS